MKRLWLIYLGRTVNVFQTKHCCSLLALSSDFALHNEWTSRKGWHRMTRRCRSQGSDPIPDTVVRQWNKTNSCYGSRQTLTSASDSVLCLTRMAHARFLADTTHFSWWRQSLSVARQCLIVTRDLRSVYHLVTWWRQSLSVARQCLIVTRDLRWVYHLVTWWRCSLCYTLPFRQTP